MPALNFQFQFRQKILTGKKRQTIRATRKRPIQPGDKLVLYTGMRTANCTKLFETQCTKITPIIIFQMTNVRPAMVKLGKKFLSPGEIKILALADGFSSVGKFLGFFLPPGKNSPKRFEGTLIEWTPPALDDALDDEDLSA